MEQLSVCFDCGHQISPKASRCPKCQSADPHGVICRFCYDQGGSRVSAKKAHSHPHDFRQGVDNKHYYHVECIQRLMAIPSNASCPDCRVQLFGLWKWNELCEGGPSCKKCGSPDVLGGGGFIWQSPGYCSKCSLPIFSFHTREKVGDVYGWDYYHDSCLKVVRAKAQRLAELEAQEEKLKAKAGGCLTVAALILMVIILLSR
jgi:hypothetical protein